MQMDAVKTFKNILFNSLRDRHAESRILCSIRCEWPFFGVRVKYLKPSIFIEGDKARMVYYELLYVRIRRFAWNFINLRLLIFASEFVLDCCYELSAGQVVKEPVLRDDYF